MLYYRYKIYNIIDFKLIIINNIIKPKTILIYTNIQ